MTSLITGNRGFVGQHLMQLLVSRGEKDVIGFDLMNDYPTTEVLHDFMSRHKVDKIYHLGARAFIPSCYSNEILNVINSNITFTGNMLVAAKKAGVKKILYFSTSEIYGNQKFLPIGPDHMPKPQSTYAASKFAAENLCRTFCRESNMDVAVLRHFNIYGPWDTQPRIIPKIMSIYKHKKETHLGNTSVTRDFTYVTDACLAAYNVMNYPESNGEIYTHGTGVETSVGDLITMIEKLYGETTRPIETDEHLKRPWDVERLQCDRKKYEKAFPNHVPIDISTGLKITKEWYDTHVWPWEV